MALPIDKTKALEIVDGDEDLYRELVRMLLDEAIRETTEIEKALQAGDARTVERTAHSLKGAAANLAAEPIRSIAWELEQAGRSGDLSAGKGLIAELQRCVADLFRFLERAG